MRDQDYQVSIDFLKRFFGEASHKVELRACANDRSGGARSIFTRDDEEMRAFLRRTDQPGWGSYFGLCTRRDGVEKGNKENVVECVALWTDMDCAKQGISGADALRALQFLPFPPSIVINSGGGLHAYWLLEEPVDVSGRRFDLVELACRRLALILAGDTSCAEVARILRVPGTMNSKDATRALNDGEPAIVEIIEDNDRVYDFGQLAEWLAEQRAVLTGKLQPSNIRVNEDDPWIIYGKSIGYTPAIDIQEQIAAITPGHHYYGIHPTQLRISGSMIAHGFSDDEIVDLLLKATAIHAPRDKQWNWEREERDLRGMIRTGRGKGYDDKVAEKATATPAGTLPQANGNTARSVVWLSEERAKREKPKKAKGEANNEISVLGGAALAVWKDRYGPLIHTRGTTYAYESGIWAMWDDRHDQMLRAIMQEGCESLNMAPKSSLLASATAYFLNRPELFQRDADFDNHNLIIAGDGTIDPRTMLVGEHSPDHRALFKVSANLDGARECPTFIAFLKEAFSDKAEADIPEIIRTIQEWFGACLVTNKPRSLAKGMLVHGASRTGKTQLSEILRALLGKGKTAATSIGDIGSDFGLQGFIGMRGWIADDAIGQGETLDAERYKKIITGEEIGVRRKNRTDLQMRFGFAVMITANHLPRIKDQSDAVYNRSLILQMTRVRPEGNPEPAGYNSISEKIIKEELSGVLWWAIEGWQRLKARGIYTEPGCMKKAMKELQKNNNSVRTWMEECAAEDPSFKVANADLFASFAGWYYQENGEGRFPWSQNGFIRAVKELLPNLGYQKGAKTRNLTGIMLNEDGKEYWSINCSREGVSIPKAAAIDVYAVNQDFSSAHAERASGGRTVF